MNACFLTAQILKSVKIFNFDRFPKESEMERSVVESSFGKFKILLNQPISR